MPNYFAVPDRSILTHKVSYQNSQFVFHRQAQLNVIDEREIVKACRQSKKLMAFSDEQTAIDNIKGQSDYIDSFASFESYPLVKIDYPYEIDARNGAEIPSAEAILKEGKMLYIANQFIATLPYKSLVEADLDLKQAHTQQRDGLGPDLRYAIGYGLLLGTVCTVLNLMVFKTNEKLSPFVIGFFLGVLLYTKKSIANAETTNNNDINDEIKRHALR